MTNSKKEINVACNYLLRLIKAHVQLSADQINLFKRVFSEILSKRFLGHWFPATPHRGSAYRCLQTKHWKDPLLKTIAEHCRLPLHRYLPTVFTVWIDPGEVAVCFGDEGTWCPLYKHGIDGEIHQEYSDGEETVSSVSSDDDLLSLPQNTNDSTNSSYKQINTDCNHTRTSSPSFNSLTTTEVQSIKDSDNSESNMYSIANNHQFSFWPTQLPMSDSLLFPHQQENV